MGSFGSYNATYGALGGMVVLLIWFFLTGYILILGAELNAIVDQQVDPAKVQQRRQQKQVEAAHQRGDPADVRPAAGPTAPAGAPPGARPRGGFGGRLLGLAGLLAALVLLRRRGTTP